MPFLAILAFTILLNTALYLLRPQPSAQRQNFDIGAIPRADESSPVPIIVGTNRIYPNCIFVWLNTGGAVPIKKATFSVKGSQTIGYKYGGTFHFLLGMAGYGNATQDIKRFWLGEKLVNSNIGPVRNKNSFYLPTGLGDVANLYIARPTLWGGEGNGGGADGYITWRDGSQSARHDLYNYWYTSAGQVANYVLEHPEVLFDPGAFRGIDAGLVPDYRNWIGVQLGNFYFGESPALPPPSFEVQQLPNYSGQISSNNIGVDANPAAAIYMLLRDPWLGLGMDFSEVSATSLSDASVTLAAEANGVSFVIEQATDASDIFDEICRQIDGLLYYDHSDGQIKIRLVRNDYVVGDIAALNPSNVISIDEFSTQQYDDVFNKVRLTWNDRGRSYKERTYSRLDSSNLVNQADKVRTVDVKFPFCKSSALAVKLADRTMRVMSIPRRAIRIKCNREAFDLIPGEVFALTWPDYDIENMVFRVQTQDLGTFSENTITIEAVQDIFDALGAAQAEENPTVNHPNHPRPPGLNLHKLPSAGGTTLAPGGLRARAPSIAMEVPRFHANKLQALSVQGATTTRAQVMYVMAAERIEDTEFHGQSASARTTVNDQQQKLQENEVTFHNHALFSVAYPRSTSSYDTSVGIDIYGVTDIDELVTATAAEIRANGKNMVYANGEFMSFESVTDNGDGTYKLNNVWRELLDTRPKDHAVDDVLLFVNPENIQNLTGAVFDGDETINYEIRTFNGVQASVPVTGTLELVGRQLLPYSPQDLTARFDTLDPNSQPALSKTMPTYNTAPEIDMQWKTRNATTTTIVRGDDASETPESGTNHEIQGKYIGDDDWTTLKTALGAFTTGSSPINTGLGWGDHEFRVMAYRDIDPSAGTDIRYSFDGPAVLVNHHHLRQLLMSPNGNNKSEGWTINSGAASFNVVPSLGTVTTWGGVGTVIKATGTGFNISQVVDVTKLLPVGKIAHFTYYTKNDDSDPGDTFTAKIEALNASNVVLSASSLGATAAATATWDSRFLTLTDLPHGAAKLKVTLSTTAVGGGDVLAATMFTGLDLRLGLAATGNSLTNGSFTTNVSGWTAVGSAWSQTNNSTGLKPATLAGGMVQAPNDVLAELYQDYTAISLNAFDEGNSALIKWQQANNNLALLARGKVIVEARNSVGTVLESWDSGYSNPDAQDTWRRRELAFDLPPSTETVRVRLLADRNGGNASHIHFDEVELLFSGRNPLLVPRRRQLVSATDTANKMGATPSNLWLFDQDTSATSATDMVGFQVLTEVNAPDWAQDAGDGGTGYAVFDSRTVRFSATNQALVSSDDSLGYAGHPEKDDSFAVYFEVMLNDVLEGNIVSKVDASGVGYRVFGENVGGDTSLVFEVNNGVDDAFQNRTTFPSGNTGEGYMLRCLCVFGKELIPNSQTEYTWTSNMYSSLLLPGSGLALYEVDDEEDPVRLGASNGYVAQGSGAMDLLNAGFFTLGEDELLGAVSGIEYVQVALFLFNQALALGKEEFELVGRAKGYSEETFAAS